MLTHLAVRDFAIVEQVELELDGGMTVLTGETGAGKSILVDALSLALGARAGADSVRAGAGRTEIAATFDLTDAPAAREWLAKRDLDDGGGTDAAMDDQALSGTLCIIRRVVARSGPSRAFVNDRPVTVGALRELGELLVNVHGQHAQQSLQRPGAARAVLDAYASRTDPRHAAKIAQAADASADWRKLRAQIDSLTMSDVDRESRLALLGFQLEELDERGPVEDEIERLARDHRRLAHAHELVTECARAYDFLVGEGDSASAQLDGAIQSMASVRNFDSSLDDVTAMLESARVEVVEAAAALRRRDGSNNPEPGDLDAVERRLGEVHELARKHRVRPEELVTLRERIRDEVSELEHGHARVAELEHQAERALVAYGKAARKLGASRRKAALRLDPALSAGMAELGMERGRFETHFADLSQAERRGPSPQGEERIEFRVSTNPGQPTKSLAEVASGGELSRIALAIVVIASAHDGAPTLIFDEVDTGVGGRVADMVGQRLRSLADRHQVMCVTHLPQVACHAQAHLQVEKRADDTHTRTAIRLLDAKGRVNELARMLGGAKITRQTMAHAREMLSR